MHLPSSRCISILKVTQRLPCRALPLKDGAGAPLGGSSAKRRFLHGEEISFKCRCQAADAALLFKIFCFCSAAPKPPKDTLRHTEAACC